MAYVACIALLIGVFAYTFWPEKNPFVQRATSRIDFLRERRESIFANLRDLNFEYKAGKYPEDDYATQRAMLEDEAAVIVREIDTLERA
ncbi:hypothetical protein [Terriglobus sp. TAA 43]|uniref:hypothetical protein n=1 Tax=Terriglobus sp. TAA 43 TaxID=278961 RepID=UPI00064742A3|nr:hypothetical protein [Terriglobus sp. TAA 43]